MSQNKGLKSSTIWLMTGVALLFDAIQAALSYLFLGWLMIPVFYMTYWMWFKMNGVKFLTLKRAPTQAIGGILEVISAGIIPAFTFIVARVALTSKMEEISSSHPNVIDIATKRKGGNDTSNDSGENRRAA